MPRTLERYVFTQIAAGVFLAFSIIFVMIVLVDFVELSRSVGSAVEVSPFTLASFALLRAPSLIETTLPFIVLFGSMWAMFRLNRRSELVAMRASGLSAWRFIAPAAFFAVAFGVLATTIFNPVAARLNAEFERREAQVTERLSAGVEVAEAGGLWLREGRPDGQLVMRAERSSDGGGSLEGVTVFEYLLDSRDDPVFTRRYDAAQATLTSGFWQLYQAWESAPDASSLFHENLAIPTEIIPSSIVNRAGAPRNFDFWRLPRHARLLQSAGFSHEAFILRWHQLLALPLSLAAMAVVASAASLSHIRRGGAFRLALLAAVCGFGVYFGDRVVASLGLADILPIFAAAWATPVFTLLAGLFVIATVEDG